MTLQSSGQIKKSEIAAEFSVTGGNFRIETFYRGGENVSDIAANIGIPTTGEIKFSDFYGAGGAAPVVSNIIEVVYLDPVLTEGVTASLRSQYDTNPNQTLYVRFEGNGNIVLLNDFGGGLEEWYAYEIGAPVPYWYFNNTTPPTQTTNDYWIRATKYHGPFNTTSGGVALGTWHKLTGTGSSNAQYEFTSSSDYIQTIKVEISIDGGNTIPTYGYVTFQQATA